MTSQLTFCLGMVGLIIFCRALYSSAVASVRGRIIGYCEQHNNGGSHDSGRSCPLEYAPDSARHVRDSAQSSSILERRLPMKRYIGALSFAFSFLFICSCAYNKPNNSSNPSKQQTQTSSLLTGISSTPSPVDLAFDSFFDSYYSWDGIGNPF